MLGQSSRWLISASLLAGLLAIGCADPDGQYADFQEREKKTTPIGGTGCGDPAAACDPPTASALTGQWLFALAATVGPTKPVLFFADITATDTAGQLTWQWTLTPLDAKTRTPLAPLPPLAASPVPADGNWSADLAPITVPGAANPITTGSDIVADTVLTGKVCSKRDFLCGDVTGQLTKPITLDLKGSHWTLERLKTPNTLPDEIFVDCTCRKADPLPG